MAALLIIIAGIIVFVWLQRRMMQLGDTLEKLGDRLIESACTMKSYPKRDHKPLPDPETQKVSDRLQTIKEGESDEDYRNRVRKEIDGLTAVS